MTGVTNRHLLVLGVGCGAVTTVLAAVLFVASLGGTRDVRALEERVRTLEAEARQGRAELARTRARAAELSRTVDDLAGRLAAVACERALESLLSSAAPPDTP